MSAALLRCAMLFSKIGVLELRTAFLEKGQAGIVGGESRYDVSCFSSFDFISSSQNARVIDLEDFQEDAE